jgi:putative addiction module killer protein
VCVLCVQASAEEGYRVYYAIEGKRVVLLCDGGDKRSQTADIDRAIERWNEWQTRGKK